MMRLQDVLRAWSGPEGRRRRRARITPHSLEALEGRALLSTTPSVLSRTGSIDHHGGTDTVLMQLQPGQFTAPSSGQIRFDVELSAADGSHFVPGSFQVFRSDGKHIAATDPT